MCRKIESWRTYKRRDNVSHFDKVKIYSISFRKYFSSFPALKKWINLSFNFFKASLFFLPCLPYDLLFCALIQQSSSFIYAANILTYHFKKKTKNKLKNKRKCSAFSFVQSMILFKASISSFAILLKSGNDF